MKLGWIIAGFAVLCVGCSPGGGADRRIELPETTVDIPPEPIVHQPTVQHQALYASIEMMPETPISALPTGSVTYAGSATLSTVSDVVEARFVGESTLNFDFQTETVAGVLTSFERVLENGSAENFDGTLAISNGEITGDGVGFIADVGGTITGQNDTLWVGIPISGRLYGDDGAAVLAEEGFDLVVPASFNATAVGIDIEIAAER